MKKISLILKKLLICLVILPVIVLFPVGCKPDTENSVGTVKNDTYTVHFFTGSDQTFNIPTQVVKKGGLVNKPETPKKNNHVFIGWYVDMACTIVWTFEIDVVTQDMTLYARWQKRNT